MNADSIWQYAVRVFVCLTVLLWQTHHAFAQSLPTAVVTSHSPTDYSAVISNLEQVIRRQIAEKDIPAFSIALVDDQNVVWSAGFGFADELQTLPATADTVYRVGSVSKLFTDIAVMQLVERGELKLNEPVSQYLPEFTTRRNEEGSQVDSRSQSITLAQLMSHRAGLVREPPVGHYFDDSLPTLADTVKSLQTTELIYSPDTQTKYSNAGVTVVGRVLENMTGVSFSEYMKQAILDPLEMLDSSFDRTEAISENSAAGMMWTYDGRRFKAPHFPLGTAPAGNLYSTVNDMAKFMHCIFRDGDGGSQTIVSPATFSRMLEPAKNPDGSLQEFGLGFHVGQFEGLRKIGHGGAVYGFSTQFEALPEKKLGVIAMTSLDGVNGVVQRITDHALRLMLATKAGHPLPEFPTTESVDYQRAVQLVGNYALGQQAVHVVQLDGHVYVYSGTFRSEVRASTSGGVLVVDDVFGYGTPVGKTEDGRLRIGDRYFEQLPDSPPAEILPKWQHLIGEYGWDFNTLYVLEENGQLYALIEWFYFYPLTEVRENIFAFPDYGLYHGEQIVFETDRDGNPTNAIAASVRFPRREVGTKNGETFRITPVRAIKEIRQEAIQAEPPAEVGEFEPSTLVDVNSIDPGVRLDIRYASTNNFTGSVFYQSSRALMQRPAAEATVQAHQKLAPYGLGLLIHDAYRPWFVTKMFWEATPDAMKDFVANPKNGSRHNRGCAVDLTLYDLTTKEPIQMVAGYDEFSARSFPLYPGGTSRQRWYREKLRQVMESVGFTVYEFEWWHFDFRDWKNYRIGNIPFEKVPAP